MKGAEMYSITHAKTVYTKICGNQEQMFEHLYEHLFLILREKLTAKSLISGVQVLHSMSAKTGIERGGASYSVRDQRPMPRKRSEATPR